MTSVSARKVTKQPVRASDRVLRELRHMIVTLELPPGAVVTEASLVQTLNCSRTPLREALQRLGHEHLVVSVPHRGISIADLSIVHVGSICQAEEAVDAALIRLAAPRITEEELDSMEELLVRSDVAAAEHDVEEVVDIDFQFHTLFGKAARNLYLLEFQEILMRLLGRYVYLGFQVEGNPEGAIRDHRDILAALRTRDPDACEAVMRAHIGSGRERMRKAL